jgi:HEAT repeat protein
MNDPEDAIRGAREQARAREWDAERILRELGSLDLIDHAFREQCAAIRDQLVPSLMQAIHDKDPNRSLQAGVLLLHLGEPEGTEGIINSLRNPEQRVRQAALVQLSILPLTPAAKESKHRRQPPVPIQREKIFQAVSGYLDRPDSRMGNLALAIAGKLDIPEANDRVRALWKHASRKVRTDVLLWMARRHEDPVDWKIPEKLLFGGKHNPHDDYWVLAALEIYCESPHREQAQKAAELLARYVRVHGGRPDTWTANFIARAVKAVAKTGYGRERPMLENVLRSAAADWRQGAALKRLAEMEGEAGIRRLETALKDRLLRKDAAQALAKLADGRRDPALLESLMDAAQEESRKEVLSELVSALLAVGGEDALPYLERLSGRLGPHEAMRVHWLSRKITPQSAVQRLTQEGIIPQPAEETVHAANKSWKEERKPELVVIQLLAACNRIVWFDCESGTAPVDYAPLIGDLLSMAKEAFPSEAVSQRADEANGESDIQFIHGRKIVAIHARNLGDWYDVESVIRGLNRALEEDERAERFMLLYTGDQSCLVTFAPGPAFRRVAADLRLPLEDDPRSAMITGTTFEEKVRTIVKKENA